MPKSRKLCSQLDTNPNSIHSNSEKNSATQNIRSEVIGYLENGQLKEAIHCFLLHLDKEHPVYTKAVALSSKYDKLNQEKKLGLVLMEDFRMQLNRIQFSIGDLITQLDAPIPPPTLPKTEATSKKSSDKTNWLKIVAALLVVVLIVIAYLIYSLN